MTAASTAERRRSRADVRTRDPRAARTAPGRVERSSAAHADNSAGEASTVIARSVAGRIGARKFDKWFGHARLSVREQRLYVETESQFVATWIEGHYAGDLRDAAVEVIGGGADVHVVVTGDQRPAADESDVAHDHADDVDDAALAALDAGANRASGPGDALSNGAHKNGGASRTKPRTSRKQRAAGVAPAAGVLDAPAPSGAWSGYRRLDEFVVGSSNDLALAAAKQIAETKDPAAISPLFIHGECGLGKSHLLLGIVRRFAEITGRGHRARYLTGETFTNEYIAAVRNNGLDSFRSRMRKLELLVVDDVHFLANKLRTQCEFMHTLDALDLAGSRVVLASSAHPREIRNLRQALISRFLSGMVVQVRRPDRDTRMEVVRALARRRSLAIQDSAVELVASHCLGSVRELEGAVTKLAALQLLAANRGHAVEVGRSLAEQLFQQSAWQPSTPVRVEDVISVVCERLAVSKGDLMGSRRHRRMVLARALVAHLSRELTTQSYPEIAQALGRTYHSTVHTAAQRLLRQLKENEEIALGGTERPLPLRELTDQLRHEVMRSTGSK